MIAGTARGFRDILPQEALAREARDRETEKASREQEQQQWQAQQHSRAQAIREQWEAQAEQACRNVQAILEANGTGFDRVVKTTCFLADMKDFAAFNAVYAKYFVSNPARSCVAVRTLPRGLLCEIEAVAAL